VVTFDPRGNGRSDRPGDYEAYRRREFAADALAVLDAAGVEALGRAAGVDLGQRAERLGVESFAALARQVGSPL